MGLCDRVTLLFCWKETTNLARSPCTPRRMNVKQMKTQARQSICLQDQWLPTLMTA